MGSIFNEAIAARLQYVTFPLELAGFALALIELRLPSTASYLSQQIERLATPMQAVRSEPGVDDSVLDRSLATFLSRVLQAGFYVLSVPFAIAFVLRIVEHGSVSGWLFGFVVSYISAIVGMTVLLVTLGLAAFFLVVGGSDFVQRFVAGRAIGTLGILIAGLGLLGVLYQLLVQMAN